jgi:hypothetical protein
LRKGKAIKFEHVWAVSMAALSLKLLWKVYHSDATKGTFLYADSTARAERLHDNRFFLILVELNGLDSRTNRGAISHTRLVAVLRFASLSIYDCDTNHCKQLKNRSRK